MSFDILISQMKKALFYISEKWPLTLEGRHSDEGGAEHVQEVQLQVNSAEREEHAEDRGPDQNPQNPGAEIQRSQPAEGSISNQSFLQL